jgi:UPF0755 protein
VAAVFVNRLRRGMRLQSDPTIIYGITKENRSVARSDERDRDKTPDTYQINSLPQTPIWRG